MKRTRAENCYIKGIKQPLKASSSFLDLSINAYEQDKDIRDEEGKRKLQVVQNPSDDNKEEGLLKVINSTRSNFFHMSIETDFINRLNDASITLAKLKRVFLTPIPESLGGLQLCIKKNSSGIIKKLYPEFKLYLRNNNRFIMTGKRMQLMRSAYYLVTTEAEVTNRKSPGCLGKLRSNFQETEFSLFGTGENPKKRVPFDQVRTQHAAILYNLEESEMRGYNKMDVLLPKPTGDNEPYNYKPTIVTSSLITLES